MEETRNNDRFLQMLKAAAPYVGAQARVPIHIIIQAGELAYRLRHMPEEAELAACDFEDDRADIEGMLVHVQELSAPRERESIQTMLNFIRAGKMMQAYQSFMQTRQASMQSEAYDAQSDMETNSFPNEAGTNNSMPDRSAGSGGTSLMMEFLMSQLSPEQKNNLDMLKAVMEMQAVTNSERSEADGSTGLD